jgi:alpha-tubulin suppressor-like RCC1 family protein
MRCEDHDGPFHGIWSTHQCRGGERHDKGGVMNRSWRILFVGSIGLALGALSVVMVPGTALAKTPKSEKPKITKVIVSSKKVDTADGSVSVSADVVNSTSCTLDSTPAVTGLPETVSCSSGSASWKVLPPANDQSKKAENYKFGVTASGNGLVATKKAPTVGVTPGAGGGTPYGVTSIASGDGNYCALLNTDEVDCWGAGQQGQLGDGQDANSKTPAPVEGIDGVGRLDNVFAAAGGGTIASGGNGFCAILNSGGIDCWGSNNYGELGDGNTGGSSATPVAVEGLSGIQFTSITASGPTYCATTLFSQGSLASNVYCWGYGTDGELGDGQFTSSASPVLVKNSSDSGPLVGAANLTGLNQAVGDGNAFCITHTESSIQGYVLCWGDGANGQLGDSSTSNSDVPAFVMIEPEFLTGVTSLVSDGNGFCGLEASNSGTVTCWGYGSDGDLGDGSSSTSDSAVSVRNSGGSTALTGAQGLAGDVYSDVEVDDAYCAVVADSGSNLAECWGLGGYGELGDNSLNNSNLPVPVLTSHSFPAFLDNVESIAGNFGSPYLGGDWPTFCAIVSTGGNEVACWGDNEFGELGTGTIGGSSDIAVPVQNVGESAPVSGVQSLAEDGGGYCAVLSSQNVECWGSGVLSPTGGAPYSPTMS